MRAWVGVLLYHAWFVNRRSSPHCVLRPWVVALLHRPWVVNRRSTTKKDQRGDQRRVALKGNFPGFSSCACLDGGSTSPMSCKHALNGFLHRNPANLCKPQVCDFLKGVSETTTSCARSSSTQSTLAQGPVWSPSRDLLSVVGC